MCKSDVIVLGALSEGLYTLYTTPQKQGHKTSDTQYEVTDLLGTIMYSI